MSTPDPARRASLVFIWAAVITTLTWGTIGFITVNPAVLFFPGVFILAAVLGIELLLAFLWGKRQTNLRQPNHEDDDWLIDRKYHRR